MKITGLAVSVGLLLGAILAVPQDRQDIPTFASKVELVTVDAVVVDGKGQPVRGLTSLDFDLFEDGKPQKVESFEAFDLGGGPGTQRRDRAARGHEPPRELTGLANVRPGRGRRRSCSLAPTGDPERHRAVRRNRPP